ncbi:MAG TPA: hypothetical protein PLZ93_05170 [Nocardioides sp.]|uniref:hypothetical protein n=1 Tax=uncultured Nocardioides sp. TaxID=198441 RepID=UPI000EC3F7A7|nr:hypothetical protein [uncultured Nocardioides sp.]HCB07140.1 hypothetical protein [Nocardioides sp.]HRD59313.1 hypothetical protein [Nocardioides sp.]HRI94979.1 hypothetical protein [Nocardioides sp.]HRK45064.1 hypothetical protein [Nocardioides sp.]
MSIRTALVALATAGLLFASTGPASAARNPEADKDAGPGEDAGHHLGYPSPTIAWHGCQKTSSQVTPADQDEQYGVPAQPTKGNKQNKVTWTVTGGRSDYVVSWKVASGWKICGAEAAVLGTDPEQTFDLAMQIGYTSKKGSGSAKAGPQPFKVKITKRDLRDSGVDEMYAGNWSISKIYSITVYITKKKR